MRQDKWNEGHTIVAIVLGIVFLAVCITNFSTNILPYILVAVVWLFVLAFAALIIFLIAWWIRNNTAPTTRVPAKVIRKRHDSKDISLDLDAASGVNQYMMMGSNPEEASKVISQNARKPSTSDLVAYQYADCFITFSFDGREEKFRVPVELYQNTPEGTEGLLVFQGEIFKHFIPGIKDVTAGVS